MKAKRLLIPRRELGARGELELRAKDPPQVVLVRFILPMVEEVDLDAPVLRLALFVLVVGQRPLFTVVGEASAIGDLKLESSSS